MYYLGINMAVQPYGFAINRNDEMIYVVNSKSSYIHSESMIYQIKQALLRYDLGFEDLSGIGITAGPGQYTGVRLGVAMANSIAMISQIPIITQSTHNALVSSFIHQEGVVWVSIPSRKNESLIQLFGVKDYIINPLTPFFSISNKQLILALNQCKDRVYYISTQPVFVQNKHVIQVTIPINPIELAQYARSMITSQGAVSHALIKPIYSHLPV
jgi:tRNA threonylcarbamoyladenosine biosynthesis protein TsaB